MKRGGSDLADGTFAVYRKADRRFLRPLSDEHQGRTDRRPSFAGGAQTAPASCGRRCQRYLYIKNNPGSTRKNPFGLATSLRSQERKSLTFYELSGNLSRTLSRYRMPTGASGSRMHSASVSRPPTAIAPRDFSTLGQYQGTHLRSATGSRASPPTHSAASNGVARPSTHCARRVALLSLERQAHLFREAERWAVLLVDQRIEPYARICSNTNVATSAQIAGAGPARGGPPACPG